MKIRSHCPINFTLEHIGDKWTLLIIRDLMFKQKRHYNEFLSSTENVSTSVLGDRLKTLEENGIIEKQADAVKKSRYKYSLTRKGIELVPILLEMTIWGGKNDAFTEANKDFLNQIKKDRNNLVSSIKAMLESEHL